MARIGAAVFAVGVALGGPQAGLALADGEESDAVAPAAREAKGAAGRAGRASESRATESPTTVRAGERRGGRTAQPQAVPVAEEAHARGAAAVADRVPADGSGDPVANGSAHIGISPPATEPVDASAAPVVVLGTEPAVALPPVPAVDAGTPLVVAATSAVTLPEPPRAAAAPAGGTVEAVNQAVVGWLDSATAWLSGLPGGPLADLLSGALLLVRRGLFDQAPAADPVQMATNSLAQIKGDLQARDPEGDPLNFEVVEAPRFGDVEISADGEYLYTPGPEFLGEDSFTVKVIDANGGFNILNPGGTLASYIEVRLPDLGSPFDAGNPDEVVLSLYGVPAQLRIERQNGTYRGTVSLAIPDDTPLTWLDEDGRDGTISALQVAQNWSSIEDAGSVRLAVDFLNGDGVAQMAVLDAVSGTYDAGRYVFTGELAPAAKDGAGIDSYYDVLGPVYKPRIDAFLAEVLADPGSVYELSVDGANLFLDTWSVRDWREELAESDLGIPEDEIFSLLGPSPAGATEVIEFNQLLNKDVGGTKARGRLKGAIDHALGGGKPGWVGDPIFSDPSLRPKLCNGYGECNAYVYLFNLSKSDGGLYSILSKSFSLGSDGQSVDFSLDFGPAVYGYAAVPKGVVAMTDLSQYSLGFFVSLVSGPSVTLKLGTGDGKFKVAEKELFAAEKYYPTEFGTFSIGGDLTAALNAEVKLQQGFTKDKLKASLYVKAGGAYLFNVDKFPTVGQDVPQFVFASGYFLDPDYEDFKAITEVVVSPTLTPSVTASWGLFTPKDTPVIKRTEAFSLNLGYSNPVSADLTFAANTSPSLTMGTKGDLTFSASVFKEIVDNGIAKIPGLGSVKGKTTYTYEKELFNVESQNLLKL